MMEETVKIIKSKYGISNIELYNDDGILIKAVSNKTIFSYDNKW